MPASLLRSPSQWTVEIHGNISITIALFIVRALWFLGAGRDKAVEPVAEKEKVFAASSTTAGIPAGWYYLFAIVEPVRLPVKSWGIHADLLRSSCSLRPSISFCSHTSMAKLFCPNDTSASRRSLVTLSADRLSSAAWGHVRLDTALRAMERWLADQLR